jgi:hypothetical protein
MPQQDHSHPRQSHHTFLRVAGLLWLVAVLAIVIGAQVAPHLGRLTDVFLHHTVHRDWQRLSLQTAQPFFDLSTPQHTVKTYYSALYRGDADAMQRLTDEPFRTQMHQRMAHAEATSERPTYHSYVRLDESAMALAVVVEKFHLFWRRGLRFTLQRTATDWRIIGIDLVQ